jgi:uncharacterized protein (TIGR03435 family)
VKTWIRTTVVLLLVSWGVHSSQGQSRSSVPPPMAFEVAFVKVNKSVNGSWSTECPAGTGGRCRAANASLLRLIGAAYDLPVLSANQYISGIPGSISNERYNIEAKAASASATPREVRLMLQNLLADRFKLKLHEETKLIGGYALVVAKGGPKLRRLEDKGRRGTVRVGIGATSTAELVMSLSSMLEAPVVDKTNISGGHDFMVAWESLHNDDQPPSIFTVIEEQFGLKLESQKVPLKILVIDHVEKPTEN